jgi:hypothetical protein
MTFGWRIYPGPMDSQLEPTESGRSTRHRRRWLFVGIPVGLALLFVITVFTGVPGLRPSLGSLHALADKINECSPGAASVDWVIGEVNTNGEPMGPGVELTADERRMLGANGKVGYLCPPVPIE